MIARPPRPWVLSTLLHGAVAAVALLLILRFNREASADLVNREPASAVFRVEALPDFSARPQAIVPEVAFTLVPVTVVAAFPERVEPEAPAPTDRPASVKPPPVARASESLHPARPVTTLAEHRRLHPPAVPASVAAARPPAGAPTKIDLAAILTEAPADSLVKSAGGGQAEQSDYLGRLLGGLRAAHEKPSGLDDSLQAQVEFVLRADGTIGDVRIVRSSGSGPFDASVLAAFRRLRNPGTPPAGLAGVNRVLFCTRAD